MAKYHEITVRVALPDDEFDKAKTLIALEPVIASLRTVLDAGGVEHVICHATKSERKKKEGRADRSRTAA